MIIHQQTDAQLTHDRQNAATPIQLIRAENNAASQRQAAQLAERTATQARLEEQRRKYRNEAQA